MILLLKENERYQGLENDEVQTWVAQEEAPGGDQSEIPNEFEIAQATSQIVDTYE